MSLTPKQVYTENKIRLGYSSLDVGLWQALCRQAEMEAGNSINNLYRIIDLAKHTESDVLDMISAGRTLSGQKSVNEKFMAALINSMASDDEGVTAGPDVDLTAEEELSSSGSYEETSEPSSGSRLTSAECYQIDGFVVADDDDDDVDREDKVSPAAFMRKSAASTMATLNGNVIRGDGAKDRKRLLKRRLSPIEEEAEE